MPSRRSLEKRLERLEDDTGDYPNVTLCELLSADEIKTDDRERGVVRVDGELMVDGYGLQEAVLDNL